MINAPGQVGIRPINADDLDRICGWLNQDDVANALLLDRGPSLEEEIQWFRKYSADDSKKVFAIEYEGRHVGNVSLFNIDIKNLRAMLSIIIGEKDLRGKGIGSDAICLALNIAFRELHLAKVSLEVFTDNEKAIKCYKRVGMKKEGVLRSHVNLNKKRHDMLLFSILKEEFVGK